MRVDDDFEGIAPTTFSLMRARMTLHDSDLALFEATLAKAVKAGIFKGKLTAIIDSSPVRGAGNVADTYELIRKMIGRLTRATGGASRRGVVGGVCRIRGHYTGHRLGRPDGPGGASGGPGRPGGRDGCHRHDERGGRGSGGGRSGPVAGRRGPQPSFGARSIRASSDIPSGILCWSWARNLNF
jgi:hypothetical protein